MPTFYPSISADLREWMLKQPLFFTASAPLTGKHINVSPKGYPTRTFSLLGPNQAAYLDATGSGCETISHIYENGRVTIMFCSFGPSPRILRLFCRGRVVERADPMFRQWVTRMENAGMVEFGKGVRKGLEDSVEAYRAVIVLDVWKVQTSCGFGVPVLAPGDKWAVGETEEGRDEEISKDNLDQKFWGDRETMDKWAAHTVSKGKLVEWRKTWNSRSLDGCAGLKTARKEQGQWLWADEIKAGGLRMVRQWDSFLAGILVTLIVLLMTRNGGLLMNLA